MRTNRQKQFSALIIGVGLFVWVVSGAKPDRRESVDIVIRGGTIVTMNDERTIIENGFVAIKGGRISALGPAADLSSKYVGRSTLDAAGKLILPGLINTHTHAPMSLFRGMADDLTLMDWLTKYIFPAEAKNVTPDFVKWGTYLACLEMIRSGTTTYADMYYFEDEVAQATKEAGMRAVLGETILDFPAPDNKTVNAALQYTEKYLKKWKGDSLIVPAVAPHAPYTCSSDTLTAAKSLADKFNAPLLIHLSETKSEVQRIKEKYNATSTAYLNKLGFLRERVVAAHAIWLTDEDIQILKEKKVGVAHCPESNMKLASGVAPITKLLRMGIPVGLGTDGAASNNNLDMFEEMDTAAKLHKLYTNDPTVIRAEEAVAMATRDGARVLGLDREIGSLEVNKKADLIVLALNHPSEIPLYNVYSHLVYAIKGARVETSIINGSFVMREGKILTLKEKAVYSKAQEYRDKIIKSLKSSSRGKNSARDRFAVNSELSGRRIERGF